MSNKVKDFVMEKEKLLDYSGIPLCGGKGTRIEIITKAQGGVPATRNWWKKEAVDEILLKLCSNF